MKRLVILVVALVALILSSAALVGAQAQSLPLGSNVAANESTDLRDDPEPGGALLTQMPLNAQARVIGGPFNDGWYWLDYKGTRGYGQGKALVIVDDNYQPVPPPTPTATPVPDQGYGNLWVGEMSKRGAVRTGPADNTKLVKTWWVGRRVLVYEQAQDAQGGTWFRVSDPPEGPMWVHSSIVRKVFDVKYEGAQFKGKWVNVNVTQQVVTAYVDGMPVKVTLASTGKASTPTNLGVQKVSWRVTSRRMIGGTPGIDYYDLPNVPYPQYFNSTGEALHGTYWHDNFGRPLSHGCVNLSTPMSKWFYDWGYVGMTVWAHR